MDAAQNDSISFVPSAMGPHIVRALEVRGLKQQPVWLSRREVYSLKAGMTNGIQWNYLEERASEMHMKGDVEVR